MGKLFGSEATLTFNVDIDVSSQCNAPSHIKRTSEHSSSDSNSGSGSSATWDAT